MYPNKKVESKDNKFLKLNPENENLNQYWFSEATIKFFDNQVEKYSSMSNSIAFVSTPSLFFSCSPEIQNKSMLFDYDEKLIKKHKNCRLYDFNNLDYSAFPGKSFDFIIIDPPFITEEAWTKFASFVNYLAIEDKVKLKILTCSIAENATLLERLLGLKMKKYQPSIPHLVYQYNVYANYEDEELDKVNSEIAME